MEQIIKAYPDLEKDIRQALCYTVPPPEPY